MMKELRVVHYAVSLGHHRSLAPGTDDLVASSSFEGPALDSYRDYAGDGVFRLSVGLEDPQDIL